MTPSARSYTLRYPVSGLRRGGRIRRLRLDHFREEKGELVCAEGESAAYTLPSGTTDLFCANNRVFAYRQGAQSGSFLDTGVSYPAGASMHNFVALTDHEGGTRYFAIGGSYFYYYADTAGSIVTFSPTPSTTALALHHERLFGAAGSRVYYTKPLDFRGWENYGEHDAGYFDLLPGAGTVVDIFSMRDRLFFLRRYGITRLTGYCDIYDFVQVPMPFGAGETLSRAAVIGESAYFLTSAGLCRFDGSKTERVEGASDEEIALAGEIRAGLFGYTKFAADVTLRDGGSAVYVFDTVTERGYFIRRSYEACAFSAYVYTMRGGVCYRLTGKDVPASGACRVLADLSFSDLGEGEKRLEAVHLAGSGTFTVTAQGCEGSAEVTAKAGEWARFPAAVRGEDVSLTVRASSSDASIGSLSLRVRREDRL